MFFLCLPIVFDWFIICNVIIFIVYDVSQSQFYTGDGPYSIFAGHDATYNLAKNSLKSETLDIFSKELLDKLSFVEKESLLGFVQRFELKYPCVGWLKEYRFLHPEEEEEDSSKSLFDITLETQHDAAAAAADTVEVGEASISSKSDKMKKKND